MNHFKLNTYESKLKKDLKTLHSFNINEIDQGDIFPIYVISFGVEEAGYEIYVSFKIFELNHLVQFSVEFINSEIERFYEMNKDGGHNIDFLKTQKEYKCLSLDKKYDNLFLLKNYTEQMNLVMSKSKTPREFYSNIMNWENIYNNNIPEFPLILD